MPVSVPQGVPCPSVYLRVVITRVYLRVVITRVYLRVVHTYRCTSGWSIPTGVPQGVDNPVYMPLRVLITRCICPSGCVYPTGVPQGVCIPPVYLRVFLTVLWEIYRCFSPFFGRFTAVSHRFCSLFHCFMLSFCSVSDGFRPVLPLGWVSVLLARVPEVYPHRCAHSSPFCQF